MSPERVQELANADKETAKQTEEVVHDAGCWRRGPLHYHCAIEHIRRLERELAELND